MLGPEGPPIDPVQAYVLRPEEYTQILYDLGFERQHVGCRSTHTSYPAVVTSSNGCAARC